MFGQRNATRSLRSTPWLQSADARRLQRAWSSAYVYRRSPWTTAVRSPIVSALRFRKLSGLSSSRDGTACMAGLSSVSVREMPAPRAAQTAPVRGRTGSEVRAGDLEQPGHAVAQGAGPRVVALAAPVAAVDCLAEDGRLPQRERLVPAQARDVAARPLRVSSDELVARREALGGGDGREQQRVLVRARLRPAHGQVAEGGERVADRRHLPVEDRDEPRRRVEADHDVAEPVVAVHDGRRWALGHRRLEPLADLEAVGELARRVDLPQARPAAELALEVAGRLAEPVEPARRVVDGVEVDEAVDELEAEPAALVGRVDRLRDPVGDDRANDLLHDVERRADDAVVLADGEDLRHAHAAAAQADLDVRLAHHVVRGRRQRGRRRPAQDDARALALDEIREVRRPVPDAGGA